MIKIRIEVEIPDSDFKEQKKRLIEFYNINERPDEELATRLKGLLAAALYEYADMIVGRGFSTRAEDIRQYRLFCLIKYHFNGLPTESDISSMFKEPQSKSKSLIRQVLSRFRYDLEKEIAQALKKTIIKSKFHERNGKQEARVTIDSDLIVEELNRIIDREAPARQRVKKLAGTGRRYIITPDTFCALNKSIKPETELHTENYKECLEKFECPEEEQE